MSSLSVLKAGGKNSYSQNPLYGNLLNNDTSLLRKVNSVPRERKPCDLAMRLDTSGVTAIVQERTRIAMIVKKLEFNRKGMNAGIKKREREKEKYNKTEPNKYRAQVNYS